MTLDSVRGRDMVRDAVAGVFLGGALVLPWNLYFGVAIPESRPPVFAALVLATLLSATSIAVSHTGRRRLACAQPGPAQPDRLRLALNLPYLLLVSGFVLFDVVQTIRFGGSAHVPGGVGPGAWLGTAGALLATQPVNTGSAARDRFFRPLPAMRILAYASLAGAGSSVLFNLYWRIRYAVADVPDTGFHRQQVVIIMTALAYAAVAWAAVYVASRWLRQRDRSALAATAALGASTLTAGILVWVLPIGRYLDSFHGIAQNTSTAGVGFEGYLAWSAAAALVVAPTLRRAAPLTLIDADAWLAVIRKLLLLIVVWSLGSALMRGADLISAAVLGLSYSPYNSASMAAFDLFTAVLAVWLAVNLTNRALPSAALWTACAVLCGFTVARIVVGVGLSPRLAASDRLIALAHPVYGNGFAQQITSMFDVVLCGLALCALAIAITVTRLRGFQAPATARPERRHRRPGSSPRIFRRTQPPRPAAGSPRIFRAPPDSTHSEVSAG